MLLSSQALVKSALARAGKATLTSLVISVACLRTDCPVFCGPVVCFLITVIIFTALSVPWQLTAQVKLLLGVDLSICISHVAELPEKEKQISFSIETG